MIYPVQFVSRARADEKTDGHDIVFAGRVVLTAESLSVFELVVDEGANETPEFSTHLSNIKSIKCRPLSSAHGNYTGGVVRVVGVFDRFVAERITLKVGEGFYKPFVAELKTLL
jgi:hypothetical protein